MNEPVTKPLPPASKPLPEGFISKKEVARLLNVAVRTVDDWMKIGRIPFYKFGKRVSFKWSEVETTMRNTSRVYRKVR